MIKYFYPDGSGLFQDDNAPIHRTRGLTVWFSECGNDVNHMLLTSQSNGGGQCQAEYTSHNLPLYNNLSAKAIFSFI